MRIECAPEVIATEEPACSKKCPQLGDLWSGAIRIGMREIGEVFRNSVIKQPVLNISYEEAFQISESRGMR